MRKFLIVSVISLLAALPSTSSGQSSLSISAGPTYVTGPAALWAGRGYHLQAGINFGHWGPAAFRIDAIYLEREGSLARSSYSDRTYALAGSVILRHSFGPVAPFALVGTGLYGDNSWMIYTPGINAGVGVEANLPHLHLFAESRIHQYLRDARQSPPGGRSVTLIPLSFGVRF